MYFADKDHVWINGRQYISLKRVGEMMKEKRMTNADRIRAMTDEELAGFMRDRVGCRGCPRYPCTLNTVECLNAWLQWSQEEIRI